MAENSTDAIVDSINRFRNEQRAQGDTVSGIILRSLGPFENLPPAPTAGEATLFGIPVRTDPHIPEGHGIMQTACLHTYEEQQADGGGLMHLAKRHTVILKFDKESPPTAPPA